MSTSVMCAWCNGVIHDGGDAGAEASHGICFSCVKEMGLFPTESLHRLTSEQLDALPLGVIELDSACVVRRYNRTEAAAAGLDPQQVIGRHFFDEVAPCTSVREFRGRVEQMIGTGHSVRDELDFVFRFRSGDRLAHLVFAWDEAERCLTILVDLMGDRAEHGDRCASGWRPT